MDIYKKGFLIGNAVVKILGIGRNGRGAPAERWTTADMPDLAGKVIIVTGANSGIGFEAAKAFASKGAQTILACRNLEKAQAALDQILGENPNALAEIMPLDLTSLDSIHHFADQFKTSYDRLDVLLNNAGILMTPYTLTEDGFELQFGTNHLGHFALTGLLVDLLKRTPGSRVVNISSNGHRFGDMDFDNLMFAGGRDYHPLRSYGRSKLANLLFTFELQRRFEADGAGVIASAAHPGYADTNLIAFFNDRWYIKMARYLFSWVVQKPTMAALPGLRAAVDPEVSGGEYFGPNNPRESKGYPVLVEPDENALDREAARILWKVSEDLTGVRYLSNANQR